MIDFNLTSLEEQRVKDFKKECDVLIVKKQKAEYENKNPLIKQLMKTYTKNWSTPYAGINQDFYSYRIYPYETGRLIIVSCEYVEQYKDITEVV